MIIQVRPLPHVDSAERVAAKVPRSPRRRVPAASVARRSFVDEGRAWNDWAVIDSAYVLMAVAMVIAFTRAA